MITWFHTVEPAFASESVGGAKSSPDLEDVESIS
jgi:hypothetical protein